VHLLVVQRGELALYARLTARPWEGVTVIWDRRQGERRTTDLPAVIDQRRRARRRPPPETWGVLGFLMVRRRDGPL
jgi:hypothetical protein